MTLSTSVLQHKTQHGLQKGKKTFFESFSASNSRSMHHNQHMSTHKTYPVSTSQVHMHFSQFLRNGATGGGEEEESSSGPLLKKSHYGSQSFPFAFGEVSGPHSFSTGAGAKTQPSFSRFFCFILRF